MRIDRDRKEKRKKSVEFRKTEREDKKGRRDLASLPKSIPAHIMAAGFHKLCDLNLLFGVKARLDDPKDTLKQVGPDVVEFGRHLQQVVPRRFLR